MLSSRDTGFPSEILEGELYLGSERNASNLQALTLLGVEAILNMASECKNHFPLHFEYKSIDIFDDPDLIIDSYLDEAASFIDRVISEGRPVLVHCYMGVSRSSTVTLVYLMKYRGMTLQDAYDHVKIRRPKVCPNSGFMAALIRYEKALYGRVSLDADEYAPFLVMETMAPETPRAAATSSTTSASTPRSAFAFPDLEPEFSDDASLHSGDIDSDVVLAAAYEDDIMSSLSKRRGGKKAKYKLPSKATTIRAGTGGGSGGGSSGGRVGSPPPSARGPKPGRAFPSFSFPPPTDDNNDGGNGGGGGGGGFGSLSIPVSSGNAPPPITPRARDSEDRRAFSFD